MSPGRFQARSASFIQGGRRGLAAAAAAGNAESKGDPRRGRSFQWSGLPLCDFTRTDSGAQKQFLVEPRPSTPPFPHQGATVSTTPAEDGSVAIMARTLLNETHLRMQGTSDVTQYARVTSETSAAILAELRFLNQQLNWLCQVIGTEAARANGQVGKPGN